MKAGSDQTHNLIAIDGVAFLVDNYQPVRVPIQCDADIGTFFDNALPHGGEGGRADPIVDVGAIRGNADCDHVRAQFPYGARGYFVCRAVSAIDDDLEPIETYLRGYGLLYGMNIPPACVVDPAGTTDAVRLNQQRLLFQQEFDCCFGVVRKFVSVRSEQLDAIILERIVAGGNHHAQVGAHFARQQRDRRCG